MKRTTPLARSTVPLARTRKTPAAKAKPKKVSATAAKNRATETWSRYIHARDKWCQLCGKPDGVLNAHHILPKKHFTAVRTDEANGVLLCYRCHDRMHNGDSMEAVRFYTRLLGLNLYKALQTKALAGQGQKYPADFWIAERARLSQKLAELA